MTTGSRQGTHAEDLSQIVEEQRRTIDALINAAENRSHHESDMAALATWQQNLALQQRVTERTERMLVAEQLLRAVIDSVDAGLCILDGEGTVIDTNRAWDQLAGPRGDGPVTVFDLAGRAGELGPVLTEAANAFRKLLAGEQAEISVEHRVGPDGQARWIVVRLNAVQGHSAARAVVTAIDVTARKQAQEALRRATKDASPLALVARHMDDAVVVYDADGVIEWVNDAFVRMTGYPMDDAVGHTRQSLLGADLKLPTAEDYAGTDGQIVLPEFQAHDRNGRPYWIRLEMYRVVDEDGVMRMVGVEHDVTARREADESLLAAIERSEALAQELSTEKALLTGVISSVPHFTYWKDFAGRYNGHNTAYLALRGLPPETTLAGLREDELEVKDNLSRTFTELEEQVTRTGTAVIDHPVTMPAAEGPARSLLVSVLPQFGPDTQVEGVIGVGADVTLVGEMERQLHQASRLEAIGQLAAGIAHEINTPIQFVSDNVRFMADSFEQLRELIGVMDGASADNDKASAKITEIRDKLEEIDVEFLLEEIPRALGESLEGLERVAQIVRAMRDFSHPGEGRREIDVNRAIESTVQVARNEWKYHAELSLDLSEDLGQVPCYEGEFKQVVLNLIVNAAHAIDSRRGGDHTSPLGHIRISTRQVDGQAEIRVSDDGTGMPPEVRERIFDPFFTTKEVGKGTGQGLSMAYATIVQKHGGTIRVESEVGSGATFVIRLPLECEAAPQA